MAIVFDPDQNLYIEQRSDAPILSDTGLSIAAWIDEDPNTSIGTPRVLVHDRIAVQQDDPDRDAESWIRSWSQSGWESFDSTLRSARLRAEELGVELLLRPSSAGMLSDAVCTLSWVARGGGQDARLMLDPMGWIVPSMLRDLPDHLDRIEELCIEMIEHGRVSCVLIRSLRTEEAGQLIESSLGDGEPDALVILKHLSTLIERAPEIAVLAQPDLGFLGDEGGG